ncbi:sulfhydryl oxidase 1 isoform X2 [Bacillus rossius redtenbacheri]|uniref:sulfhydryl oxidase 1 isoform X2 n=1 Tax=Bacillus rossius redtenbacheri TaxID=93214 RepID=UPI002FDDEFAB
MRICLVSKVYMVVVVLLSVINTSLNAVLNLETKKLYDDLKSGRGLYTGDDKVIVLNSTSFKSSVFGSKNAWLVEFYNSWCGFCHRFAPVLRSLAADIYAWRDVLSVAAVDCSTDDNNPLCREYEVMYYPMLKLFPAGARPAALGSEVDKGNTVDSIRGSLAGLLRREQVEGRGAGWPNITPYRSSDTANLWKNVPGNVKYIFLIFEQADSTAGIEAILDLHSVNSTQIRHVTSENEGLAKLMGVSMFPSLVVLDASSTVTPLKVSDGTRTTFRQAIKAFLEAHDIPVPKEQSIVDPGDWRHIKAPDLSEIIRVAEEEKKTKKKSELVFQADLEKAVKYSLEHEVSMRKLISGAALTALQKYLAVLAKYFPVRSEHGKSFFSDLRANLDVPGVEGEAFSAGVKSAEKGGSPFVISGSQDWVGCKGSAEHYRGFPCGMWLLFHTLTVASVSQRGGEPGFDSLEVLDAMLGYVTHFFGCRDCSRHFQEMAASLSSEVTSPNASVAWLWRAHNKVNLRLAGDPSEDPAHPKVQFPSPETCPPCRDPAGAWSEPQMLQHLFRVYAPENIVVPRGKDGRPGTYSTGGGSLHATSTVIILVCATVQTAWFH